MKDQVLVREARENDFDFISGIMKNSLADYYDGDHVAHAKRIFSVHISGGIDHNGHFSMHQKMFIAEINNVPVGMIHLVKKKQGNYKISPLIVSTKYQGKRGIGSSLLKFAENYAIEHNARQIYFTVSRQNTGAYNFFIKNNYIEAGCSNGHYKSGIDEIMMYKELSLDFESLDIRIVPYAENFRCNCVDLIKSKLSDNIDCIDEDWINATFLGNDRKDTKDINSKYKVIYIALLNGCFVGFISATPKKGQPIKLMPMLAIDDDCFYSIATSIPSIMRDFGHKVYIHINPTPKEVMIFQKLVWVLESLMPNAYKEGIITQQWGKYF